MQIVTVSAHLRTLDGAPYEGSVRFTPSVSRIVSAEHGVIALGPVEAHLVDGEFTVGLLATDAADFTPTGWTYRVDDLFVNAPFRSWRLALPASTSEVDLSTVVEAEQLDGATVWQPAQPTGAAGGDLTGQYPNPVVSRLNGVAVTGTPTAGQVPTATSASTATWQTPAADSSISPSGAVTAGTSFGQTAAAGTSNAYARGDHTHGTPPAPTIGTTPGTYAAGDDARLTNARTPLAHRVSHATGGSDPLAAADIGALPASGGTLSGDLLVTGRLSGPAGSYGMIAPSRTGPNWRSALTSYQFQTGHGWSTNGTASANLNNTAGPMRGTQYASITTDTAGTQANLKRFAMQAFSLADKEIRLICRISDVSKIASLNFYVGTSSMANYFKWKLWEVSGSSQLASSGEWVTFTFGWASLNAAAGSYSMTSNGAPSTMAGFTDMQVQAVATNGQAVTVDVQAVEIIDGTSTTFPNGVVSIVFDDGAQSIWDYARPAMDGYGFRGTNYVIVGNLDTAGVMTTAENRALQDFTGWEIGLHSYSGAVHDNRYTSYTAAQVDDDIRMGKQWLVAQGFRGEGIAYPGGEYQKTTDGVGVDSIAARYFNTGRTIIFQGGGPTETHPAGMPMRMRAVSSISSVQAGAANPANLVGAGGLLDKCQYASGWLILVFHKITAGAATVATECSASDFQMIMAGIAARGIPVVPVSDVQRLYR
ncbi:polysaccharide deacetylase family protein [Streptomyces griseoluteus]